MTKTQLQVALAEATQTDKKTAGVFLDTLSALAGVPAASARKFTLAYCTQHTDPTLLAGSR